MKRLIGSCGLLLLLVCACAAATPPPEKLLSSDTLAVVSIPDYAKARGVFDQWPAALFMADPAMKPFKDKFMNKLRSDVIEPLEKEFGVKFADYRGLAQGQVTFAVTRGNWGGEGDEWPGFLLLMDARDKADLLKTNLAALKTKWVDSGKQIRAEKIRDVEFTTLIFKSDDLTKTLDKVFPDPEEGNETLEAPKPKKPARKLEWLLGQSGSLLIVGSNNKDIEKVLVSQSGGSVPTLSEQADFSGNYNALFRDSLGYGWVNLKPIVETITKRAGNREPGDAQPFRLDKILGTLGITALQSISANLRDTGDGSLMTFNINAPESARRGLLKAFAFDAKDSSPPPFVPADAVKFSRFRLDLHKTWGILENALVDAMPQMAGVIKLIVDNAGKDKDPNFDLRKQLIGNLGDDIINFEKNPRRQTLGDLQNPPELTLISSPRADQLAGSLKALTAVMPMQGKVKEREFLGRKVYSMNLPATPPPGGGKPVERTLSYTASGGFVAISTDVATLEEFMRSGDGSSKALRDTTGLTDAAQKVGGMGTGLFGYENQAETMRVLFETLKKESGSLGNLFAGTPLAGRFGITEESNKFKDWVDFSLLPPFDRVAKYFHISVWSGALNAQGWSFKIYGPNPPQMKK